MINKQSYQIQGMKQDNLVGTGFSSKFAHEIMNMRLNTIGDYTTAVWTTEKGTKEVVVNEDSPMPFYDGSTSSYKWITDKVYNSDQHYVLDDFQPIGQANINDEWILFGIVANKNTVIPSNEPEQFSVILCLHYIDNVLYGRIIYWGDLNFSSEYPIETLPFYENEMIQKVYWTDGLNQPRVINVRGADELSDGYDGSITTQFDFVQEVSLNEEVDIIKRNSGTGLFPPGTVKYCITYYHKYGQESNIVYDSPLYYPILGDRACSPDELSGDSFVITVNNVDTEHGFDYIRLYSIIRTSEDATPIVRIVEDKKISELPTTDGGTTKYAIFTDTNTTGSIIEPSILNYVGGTNIIAGTLDQKDNTLFLGNITLSRKSATEVLSDSELTILQHDPITFETDITKKMVPIQTSFFTSNNRVMDTDSIPTFERVATVDDDAQLPQTSFSSGYYKYLNQLNSYRLLRFGTNEYINYRGNSYWIKTFKYNEYYRFGIQFQDINGVWSEVIRLTDEKQCYIPPTLFEGAYYKVPYAKYQLDQEFVDKYIDAGYKRARLVCCYTSNNDRSFIAQGVVNPTVSSDKEDFVPNSMASWFFRPFKDDLGLRGATNEIITPLEIQSVRPLAGGLLPVALGKNDSTFSINSSVWTLNSPDIELDESIRTLDARAFKIKATGDIGITSRSSSVYVDATSPAPNSVGNVNVGLTDATSVQTSNIDSTSHDLTVGKWNDTDIYYSAGGNSNKKEQYPIIPFQRSTSLNNYVKDLKWAYTDSSVETSEITLTQHAKINSKIFSTLLYSNITNYWTFGANFTVSSIDFFDSTEVTPVLYDDRKVYYGNINTIAPILTDGDITTTLECHTSHQHSGVDDITQQITGYYPLYRYTSSGNLTAMYNSGNFDSASAETGPIYASDPVTITYKSTPHIVFNGTANIDTLINQSSHTYPLVLADVYRNIDSSQRFGGHNNRNNIYLPCGPSVKLEEDTDAILYGFEGDHYLMRYDCLKTYPYTTEDVNQVVEILSFMCETRVNLDGRYDRNRGLVDNTTVLPTNFNLVNTSYTQSNNFFNYTELREDEVASKLDSFPNEITWTNAKISGEDVDAWTNITLASTGDADGTVGEIEKIINVNDKLWLFQNHGIAQISYNENTAISTEANIPLELAKTGKFTGFNYLTKEIGCQNKWSINKSKNGLFWIDDSRQELLALGEGVQPISSLSGFEGFMIQELPSNFVSWNPVDFNNFVTYYDKLSNDVYYINDNYCLAWNEETKTFTSFYNYEEVPYMMNIGSHSLLWKDGIWAAREADTYSTFFNESKDYWMTLVCDGQTDKGSAFPADKVFNNIEYRADVYNIDGNNTNYATSVFNKQHVWNGYQDSHECNLNGIRKFNTWRVQLPRHYGTRDRIRNPFCYIKLKQDQSVNIQTDRMILHDLAVYFDMK